MIWKDRIKQYAHRYTLTNVSGTTYDFAEVTGEVNEVGTPVSAENMNKLLQRDGDDIKDTVTTFSEAGTRANITTGENTSTIFGKIKKWFSDLKPHAFANPSTIAPLSSAAASNEKVYSEKLTYDEFAKKANRDDPTFTGQIDHITNIAWSNRKLPIGIYQVLAGPNLNYWKIFRITPINAFGVVLRITNFPYASNPLCFADISINTYIDGNVVVNGYKYQNFANAFGTLYWTVDITNNAIDFYYKPPTKGAGIGISMSSGYNHAGHPSISFVSDGTNVLPYDTGLTAKPATPSGGSAGQFLHTDYTQLAPTNNPTFTGTVTVPAPTNPTDAANKRYVDSIAIKQPDKTYVLYHATAGTNNLYLSAATYEHAYAVASAYLITISGTGSSATVDWGDGTSGNVDFTGGFNINNQADKEKYIEVHLGTNYAVIGDYAFYGCTGLTSITLPDSVTGIGIWAFRGCTGLTSITLPDRVTSIGASAFYGCTGLTSITIPDSVTSIGGWAFWGCSGLTSIALPNSVTSIGEQAFYVCTGLTSITLPDSVTGIGIWAFCDCTGLTSITLPDRVTSIGASAFYGCTGLTSVNFLGNSLPTIGSDAFEGCRIADIIAQTSELADSAATAITNAGGTLLTNYRKLY